MMMMMMIKNGDTQKKYIEALVEEQKKIQVFERELPLCLELVTKAIESYRKESKCSERTISVFEEFIPIKLSSSSSSSSLSDENKDGAMSENNNVDKKKLDWLQLWNQSPDPKPKEDEAATKKTVVMEVKRNGAFKPFQKMKYVANVAESEPFKAVISPTSSSTAESGGGRRESKQSQLHRKERRCWSPELHRRFLHALHQLGGSHVATPKQIRDLMKVDGLTNDEVKSHLQKYRLHTKRPATSVVTNRGENQQPQQFMVVEGIWAPSQDGANNRVYAPVALQPPGERSSSRRCKSQATSSATHTTHLLPLS